MKKEIPFQNICEAFEASAQRHGDRTAIIYLGTRFSYQRILGDAARFASSLGARGIGPGDRVVLYVPNSLQWVIAWLGIQKAGAQVVPITPIYTDHDLSYIANDSGARFVVCMDTNYGYVHIF